MTENCALYVRVSASDQDLEGQQRELVAEASRRGWAIAAIYGDKASAYGRIIRVEYERILPGLSLHSSCLFLICCKSYFP